MTETTAIRQAYRLQEIWIGTTDIKAGRGFDLDRIHASMLQEYRFTKTKPERAGVAREIRGQFVLLGKVRKALAEARCICGEPGYCEHMEVSE